MWLRIKAFALWAWAIVSTPAGTLSLGFLTLGGFFGGVLVCFGHVALLQYRRGLLFTMARLGLNWSEQPSAAARPPQPPFPGTASARCLGT